MKKHERKTLTLRAETVRTLIDAELRAVAGGAETALCPNTRGCPFPVLTDGCPSGKGC